MKAVRAQYRDGKIEPIEPVPETKSAEVLVIFPDAPQENGSALPEEDLTPAEWEAKLFGCGKDWWTDEVDEAVKDSLRPKPRPWDTLPEGEKLPGGPWPDEDNDAAL